MDKGGYESALRYLLAQDLDVYVIHVLSAEEVQPDVKGDLKLVDCEDADVAEITVSKPLLDRYQRNAGRFCGRCSRLLHASRDVLSDGEYRYSRRPTCFELSPKARVGAMRIAWDLLGPLQWALLLATPPAIVLLYFLKLKRETAGSFPVLIFGRVR